MKILWLVILCLAWSVMSAAADERLEGPLDCMHIRAQWGRAAPSTMCPPVPPAVHGFRPTTVPREEEGGAGSPLVEYEKELDRLGDAYLQSSPADGVDAQAVLTWLSHWAQEDALNGAVGHPPNMPLNGEGGYHQEWLLVTASLNYLKVRDDTHLPVEERRQVEAWLHRLGTSIKDRYNPKKGNHHLYWAAAAVTLAGVCSNDHRMFDWGIAAAGQGLHEVTIEGYLPQEMNRGTLASHYLYFAMVPLMLVAETAFHNGIDLYSQNGGALHRMARALMSIERNPQFLAPVIGLTQAVEPSSDGLHGVWWEIYRARFPYYLADFRDVEQQLLAHRPYRYDWAGGNTTVEFGSP